MKQIILIGVIVMTLASVFVSCEKKNNNNAITPTYGTTGNPNPDQVTVTGATTFTNPATDNTSIYVGGSGWTNPTCGSTNSITLKGFNGNVDVTLSFASPAITGTYAIASTPGNKVCSLTLLNAPGQPAGIVWVGKSGVVSVNQTSASINAAFNGVVCVQSTFNFPTVTASGVIGCSQ